jgi:regulator of sirC expression with transglutaminase-like and TPR domain
VNERPTQPNAWFEFAVALTSELESEIPLEEHRDKVVSLLDRFIRPLLDKGLHFVSPKRQAEEIGLVLFGLGGFHAAMIAIDARDYLLHHVVTRRRGAPVLLALVFHEVARRLGVRVEALSVPERVLMRVVDTQLPGGIDRSVVVDPARGGEFVDVEELLDAGDPNWLQAQSLARLQRVTLDELRHLLMSRREWGTALLVLHKQCALEPQNPVGFRERGALHRRLGARVAAIEDFETYLTLSPTGSDVQAVAESIDEIRDELHRNVGARWN